MTRSPEKSVPVSERDVVRVAAANREANDFFTRAPEFRNRAHLAELIFTVEARARHEGRLEGLEEAAKRVEERAREYRSEIAVTAFGVAAAAIRALALPEGDAHE